jgi:hypothetical protein
MVDLAEPYALREGAAFSVAATVAMVTLLAWGGAQHHRMARRYFGLLSKITDTDARDRGPFSH